jgi:hypothetical protein
VRRWINFDMARTPETNSNTHSGPERDVSNNATGYPAIASIMAKYPDFAMFRRFRALNARSILYYQAELIQVEDDIREHETQLALDPNQIVADRLKDWAAMLEEDDEYIRLVSKLRTLLREYSKLS